MKQRIQKLLAHVGVASRRAIEEMIRQGRVAVNGTVMTELPILVDPSADSVTIDGDEVELAEPKPSQMVYVLLNKPRDVYSTNATQGAQTRAIDLLGPEFPHRVYPVGRLDADSKGLLLLTNDGELTNLLTHPRYGVPKTYRTTVDGNLHGEAMTTIENGLYLIDPKTGVGTKTARAHVKLIKRTRDRTVVDITIREGKNRQIRRMLAKVGHKVRDLIRTRMGPLELGELKPGQYRFLSPREVQALRKAVRPKPEKPGRGKAASNSPSSGESSKPAPTGRKPRPKPAAQAPRSHGPTPGARKPRLIIGPDADDTQ